MEDPIKNKKIMVKVKKTKPEVSNDKVEKISKEKLLEKKESKNKNSSDLKSDVYYVQHGVTSPKGERGSYIHYKDPQGGSYNVETDRDFVKEENMPSVNQTQKMRAYNSKNKNFIK